MRTFLPIFGRSPFGPLQAHMEKVTETFRELRPFFDAFLTGREDESREIRKRILKLEHAADLVKNEIRDNLPKSLFMPVDRRDVLQLLHVQDRLSDLAEDIVVVASFLDDLKLPPDLHEPFLGVLDLSLGVAERASKLIGQLDELLEASFSGAEARDVLTEIHEIGAGEFEVDKAAYTLAKELYRRERDIGTTPMMLWQRIIELIGRIANDAEGVSDQLRLMLVR